MTLEGLFAHMNSTLNLLVGTPSPKDPLLYVENTFIHPSGWACTDGNAAVLQAEGHH